MELHSHIEKKWTQDAINLPLTHAHRELYYIIHNFFWEKFRCFPDLINCRDFNDKMQWLKLFDQDKLIVECSDKLSVKNYVKRTLGDTYLIETLAVVDDLKELKISEMPQSFVLKATHDSGSVYVVRNKAVADMRMLNETLKSALHRGYYGWENGEWAYRFVRPRIIAEECLLHNQQSSVPDYKFFCAEGKVKFLHYIYDRHSSPKEIIVDPDGNETSINLYFPRGNGFIKPATWKEMILAAEALSEPFKFVRVDFYNVDERVKFGELTFWPMAGAYHGGGQKLIGPLLDFDRTTYKRCVIGDIARLAG